MRGQVSAICAAAIISGCTAVGPGGENGSAGTGPGQQTASQRAIGQCVAMVGFGAIAGAVIGSASGSHNAGAGALAGAGLGAGACAVLLQLAAKEDRERIRRTEQQAIAQNSTRSSNFRTRSGAQAHITTTVREAPKPKASQQTAAAEFTDCRYSDTTVNVDGKTAEAGRQLWCRTTVGDWQPV